MVRPHPPLKVMQKIFQDRRDGGRALAKALVTYDKADAIVLALPRGGVPVAFEVARALKLSLDIFIVRKLGVPGQEELAMGALASGGTVVMNQRVVHELNISNEEIEAVVEREKIEIKRRERAYRDGRLPAQIKGRTVIVVDDGLATGASMLAATRALRPHAAQVIAAVPVAAESTCGELCNEVDKIVCAATPQPFFAVGMYYRNFAQTTDEEVRALLSQARSDEDARRVA